MICGMSAPNLPPANTCLECQQPLHGNAPFCPYCGAAVLSKSQREQVDGYARARVAKELEDRLADENKLVPALGDKVEEIVWKRILRYSALLAALLGVLAWFGYSSFKDITGSAKSRLEPIIADAERRAKDTQNQISTTAGEVTATQHEIDDLSKEADAQKRRLDSQSGEAAKKLDSLQKSADRADKLASDYEAKMDASIHRLDIQAARVERAVDNQAIARAYPSIDAESIAMLGQQLIDKKQKKSGEVWVHIQVSPWAIERHLISGEHLKNLASDLTQAGFIPLVGTTLLQGPVSIGLGQLGNQPAYDSCVLYYDPALKSKAEQVSKILSNYIKQLPPEPTFERFHTNSDDIPPRKEIRRYVRH